MRSTITFSNTKTKIKPRPIVGTRSYVKSMEREMRDKEFSDSMIRMMETLAGRPKR